MEAIIKVNMDNAAFESNPAAELSRILEALAKDICVVHGGMKDGIRDINGNTIGSITIKD